jgi:hypothetical protein
MKKHPLLKKWKANQYGGHKSYQSTLRYGHLDTTTTKKTSGMISNRIKGL